MIAWIPEGEQTIGSFLKTTVFIYAFWSFWKKKLWLNGFGICEKKWVSKTKNIYCKKMQVSSADEIAQNINFVIKF